MKAQPLATLFERFRQRAQYLEESNSGSMLPRLAPNDHFSKEDIAFGYLENSQCVVATDFVRPGGIEIGYIAHISMLMELGHAKNLNDPSPQVDYVIRGIIKSDLNQDVVFWETPQDLLKTSSNFQAMRECLVQLLLRKLISPQNSVYGNGIRVSIGTVDELLSLHEGCKSKREEK
jgi:hypothetical protein